MSKRLGVNLSDDTHAQIKQRADAAGVSVHSWIVAAIERENFRQLCQEANVELPDGLRVAYTRLDHVPKSLLGDRGGGGA